MSQKPTNGRIVHYRIGSDADGKPVLRPAIVVQDWGTGEHPNVQVFLDGSNDVRYREREVAEGRSPYAEPTAEECARGVAWRTSSVEGDEVGQWRWPART